MTAHRKRIDSALQPARLAAFLFSAERIENLILAARDGLGTVYDPGPLPGDVSPAEAAKTRRIAAQLDEALALLAEMRGEGSR